MLQPMMLFLAIALFELTSVAANSTDANYAHQRVSDSNYTQSIANYVNQAYSSKGYKYCHWRCHKLKVKWCGRKETQTSPSGCFKPLISYQPHLTPKPCITALVTCRAPGKVVELRMVSDGDIYRLGHRYNSLTMQLYCSKGEYFVTSSGYEVNDIFCYVEKKRRRTTPSRLSTTTEIETTTPHISYTTTEPLESTTTSAGGSSTTSEGSSSLPPESTTTSAGGSSTTHEGSSSLPPESTTTSAGGSSTTSEGSSSLPPESTTTSASGSSTTSGTGIIDSTSTLPPELTTTSESVPITTTRTRSTPSTPGGVVIQNIFV